MRLVNKMSLTDTSRARSVSNHKGVAGAGRPPSLLIVAASGKKPLSLPFDVTYKYAYAA